MTTLVLSDLRRDEAIQPLMKPTIGADGKWIEVPATWIDGVDHPVTRAALQSHALIRTPDGLREIKIKEMDDERSC